MMEQRSPAAQLRHLLAQDDVVVAPGVYDGISARMALKTGHKALYVTGAGTSASFLGRADLGFLAMNDVIHVAGMAAALGTSNSGEVIPVIADADTGFGVGPQIVSICIRSALDMTDTT
jgi:2-methylisocitrate lyase-like PEP mutase family enzyme